MKKKRILGFVITLMVFLVGIGLSFGESSGKVFTAFASEESGLMETAYGSSAAKLDDSLTLEDMLTYAIQDEYRARAEYAMIMETYGEQRPFLNIMSAEERHISALTPLFDRYRIPLPEDEGREHAILPSSLQAAYETGVQAEIDNIAMYERFLQSPGLPEDVTTVFTQLMNASKNHLEAFQRKADGSNGSGSGKNQNGFYGGKGYKR